MPNSSDSTEKGTDKLEKGRRTSTINEPLTKYTTNDTRTTQTWMEAVFRRDDHKVNAEVHEQLLLQETIKTKRVNLGIKNDNIQLAYYSNCLGRQK